MAGSITFLVVGAVASLIAALLASDEVPDRLARFPLQPGSVALELLTSTGVALPPIVAWDLTDGQPAFLRLTCSVAGFLGGALLYAVPAHILRYRARRREFAAARGAGLTRHPVPKRRGS